MRHWLAAACTIFLCACCASAEPARVHIFGGQPLEPEVWWGHVFRDVSECLTRFGKKPKAGYTDIEWFIVPAEAIPGVAGMWSAPHRIYLDSRFVLNTYVLRHEMAHAIIGGGDNHHADPAFIICTGTV